MISVNDAVILMAGSGSRFRRAGRDLLKPLIPVLGRPLASYIFETLERAGITTVHIVVGFQSEALIPQLKPSVPPGLSAHFIHNPEWQKQNGISVLAAEGHVLSPFLLTMTDHLFDAEIVDALLQQSDPNQLNLAIDLKLDSIFDLDDAMKIRTRGDRVIAIGKDLKDYDAIDTGIFVCPESIFEYLGRAKSRGRGSDCSLADGVRLMAADDQVRGIDIGEAWWQDIDTPEMLAGAEQYLQTGTKARDNGKRKAHDRHGDPQMENPLRKASQREQHKE